MNCCILSDVTKRNLLPLLVLLVDAYNIRMSRSLYRLPMSIWKIIGGFFIHVYGVKLYSSGFLSIVVSLATRYNKGVGVRKNEFIADCMALGSVGFEPTSPISIRYLSTASYTVIKYLYIFLPLKFA